MALNIDFADETGKFGEHEMNLLDGLLRFAAKEEGLEGEAELSVTVVSNEAIQELNRAYRGKDQPTDVISFAMEEKGEGETELIGEGLPRVLGDIVISAEKTAEQAEAYGHSFDRELGFLAVHGFLHLLGYDHMTKEEEERMFSRQREILDSYGLER
ncbi:MAG TPA: rRNA maturation RNase YbeY [Bacillaceae bacterium]